MWIAKLIYLFLTGAAYLFFLLYMPEFSAYLLVSMVVLPIGFFAAAKISGKNIMTQLVVPSVSVCPDKPCSCTVVFRNPTFFPIGKMRFRFCAENITLQDCTIQEFETAVPARGTAKLSISIVPTHCGIMRFSISKIRVFDLLHLFSCKKLPRCSETVLILPHVPKPRKAAVQLKAAGTTQMQPTAEPEEYLGVRSYRSGDRMRSIHWKLSSRFPEPVVREYGTPIEAPICVAFLYALQPEAPDFASRLDAMLEALVAFSEQLCRQENTATFLVCHAKQCQSYRISTPGDCIALLSNLLEAPPDTVPDVYGSVLKQAEYDVSFCIADRFLDTLPGMTVLTANSDAVPNGQLTIVPHKAAETVYRLLTKSE